MCLDWLKLRYLSLIKLIFPSKIFVIFFLSELPDAAEKLIPIFFLGQTPDESALGIAGQYEFITILLEIIEDGVVNSLYYYIGKNVANNHPIVLQGLKLSLTILLIAGTLLGLIVFFLTSSFINLIGTPAVLIKSTESFLKITSFSFPISLVAKGLLTYLYVSTSSLVLLVRLFKVVITLILNFFLFGNYSYTLGWGIDKLGLYNIIVSCLALSLSTVSFCVLEKMNPIYFIVKVPFFNKFKENFQDFIRVGWGALAESFVQNGSYFLIILKFINSMGESEMGAWYLSSNLMWSFFILPILSVINYTKVLVGNTLGSKHDNFNVTCFNIFKDSVICLTLWIFIMGIFSGLTWNAFAKLFSPNNLKIQELSVKMIQEYGWGYIVFSYTVLLDGFIFGIGRTKYIFYRNILTELSVSLIPYLLYLSDVITPNWLWVLGLSLAGYCTQLLYAVLIYGIFWKKMVRELQVTNSEEDGNTVVEEVQALA